MRKSRFSESQIIGIVKEHEAGVRVADLCRRHGISPPTLYASAVSRLHRRKARRLRSPSER